MGSLLSLFALNYSVQLVIENCFSGSRDDPLRRAGNSPAPGKWARFRLDWNGGVSSLRAGTLHPENGPRPPTKRQLPILHKEWAARSGREGVPAVSDRDSRRDRQWFLVHGALLSRWLIWTFSRAGRCLNEHKRRYLRLLPRITTWYSRTSNPSRDFSPLTLNASQGTSITFPVSSSMKWWCGLTWGSNTRTPSLSG